MKILSWEDVWQAARKLADEVRGQGFEYILAVPRGGLVPAAMLSYLLDGLPIYSSPREGQTGIAVDDLVETGLTRDVTLLAMTRFYPNGLHRFVSLFEKEPGGEWIVFP